MCVVFLMLGSFGERLLQLLGVIEPEPLLIPPAPFHRDDNMTEILEAPALEALLNDELLPVAAAVDRDIQLLRQDLTATSQALTALAAENAELRLTIDRSNRAQGQTAAAIQSLMQFSIDLVTAMSTLATEFKRYADPPPRMPGLVKVVFH